MIIGLTGGIACGKNLCTDYFASLGINIVDADVIAREIFNYPSPLIEEVARCFGKKYILSDSNIDRAKLKELIFSDISAKKKLESMTHPIIQKIALERLLTSSFSIYSAALLFETSADKLCDINIVVDIDEKLQLRRAMRRDKLSHEQIRRIMQAQLSRQQRLIKANYIIDNSGSKKQTYIQCDLILSKLNTIYGIL